MATLSSRCSPSISPVTHPCIQWFVWQTYHFPPRSGTNVGFLPVFSFLCPSLRFLIKQGWLLSDCIYKFSQSLGIQFTKPNVLLSHKTTLLPLDFVSPYERLFYTWQRNQEPKQEFRYSVLFLSNFSIANFVPCSGPGPLLFTFLFLKYHLQKCLLSLAHGNSKSTDFALRLLDTVVLYTFLFIYLFFPFLGHIRTL